MAAGPDPPAIARGPDSRPGRGRPTPPRVGCTGPQAVDLRNRASKISCVGKPRVLLVGREHRRHDVVVREALVHEPLAAAVHRDDPGSGPRSPKCGSERPTGVREGRNPRRRLGTWSRNRSTLPGRPRAPAPGRPPEWWGQARPRYRGGPAGYWSASLALAPRCQPVARMTPQRARTLWCLPPQSITAPSTPPSTRPASSPRTGKPPPHPAREARGRAGRPAHCP